MRQITVLFINSFFVFFCISAAAGVGVVAVGDEGGCDVVVSMLSLSPLIALYKCRNFEAVV